jgi:hypothetical protein
MSDRAEGKRLIASADQVLKERGTVRPDRLVKVLAPFPLSLDER